MAKRKTDETATTPETPKPPKTEQKRMRLTAPSAKEPKAKERVKLTVPKTGGAPKNDQMGELRKAENEKKSAHDFWEQQVKFSEKNRGVDWDSFVKEGQNLHDEYDEHGFGVRRNPNYDWADYRKRLRDWCERLTEAIVEDLEAKLQRMINVADLSEEDVKAFQAQIDNAQGKSAIHVVAGIISQLEASNIRDPQEEVRGGRQQGGRRRR